MTLATGTLLGRYEIRSQLGAGGMGEVYLAKDTKLDRKVALKINTIVGLNMYFAHRYDEAIDQLYAKRGCWLGC